MGAPRLRRRYVARLAIRSALRPAGLVWPCGPPLHIAGAITSGEAAGLEQSAERRAQSAERRAQRAERREQRAEFFLVKQCKGYERRA